MNKVKKYTAIYLQLNQINVLKVANKTGDLNIYVFKIMTGKNESNILTKDVSCNYKCRFDGEKNVIQIKWWNNLKCLCECKKRHG